MLWLLLHDDLINNFISFVDIKNLIKHRPIIFLFQIVTSEKLGPERLLLLLTEPQLL
jgi:hypothetical protein